MTDRHYEDRYWNYRLERALSRRSGFAWGTFLVGFVLGGIIF
ncbi:MAG: hypothetical protein AAGC77_14835 [Pseudomonadota bacterium]